MTTLPDVFAKLYAYVLLFEQYDFVTAQHPSYEQVWGDLVALLQQQEKGAQDQGIAPEDIREARYAFIAWADETIQRTAWSHKAQWRQRPLQLEYFKTRNAGEELIDKLEGPMTTQRNVREQQYLSLGLGFRGKYFRGGDDDRALSELRHQYAHSLALPIENVQYLEQIAPQPYSVPSKPGRPPRQPWLLRAGVSLLVALAAGLTYVELGKSSAPVPIQMRLQVQKMGSGNGTVHSTPGGIDCGLQCSHLFAHGTEVTLRATPAPQSVFKSWRKDCPNGAITLTADSICAAVFEVGAPPPPVAKNSPLQQPTSKPSAPLPSREEIEAKLAPALRCDAVTVSMQERVVTLAGRAESAAQGAALQKLVTEMGDFEVRTDFRIVPRPFCEVATILEPFKAYAETHNSGLLARLTQGEDYHEGDKLVVDIQTPTAFASHVYVDYYAAEGKAVTRLFPNEFETANVFSDGASLQVGNGALRWDIAPPFGLEMVTVVASTKPHIVPLLSGSMDETTAYIKRLRQALADIPPAELAASFYFLTTTPQKEK